MGFARRYTLVSSLRGRVDRAGGSDDIDDERNSDIPEAHEQHKLFRNGNGSIEPIDTEHEHRSGCMQCLD